MSKDTGEIKYQEVSLDKLIQYWVKGYEGVELAGIGDSYWIDVSKKTVILKLYMPPTNAQSKGGGYDKTQ